MPDRFAHLIAALDHQAALAHHEARRAALPEATRKATIDLHVFVGMKFAQADPVAVMRALTIVALQVAACASADEGVFAQHRAWLAWVMKDMPGTQADWRGSSPPMPPV